MKLFYRKFGEGQPLFILHGLFGQSDNWNTLAKQISEQGFEVYTVDQRNHGLSPHSNTWNYKVMSDDLKELMDSLAIDKAIVLGHSMGGKTAMQFAFEYPEMLNKLIIADIAPRYYPPHHQTILQGLNSVDFKTITTRKEADLQLSKYINDFGTKQFLLKNIYWNDNGKMDWRFNLKIINENIDIVGEATEPEYPCEVPALFIKGEKSNYIQETDIAAISTLFSKSYIATIPNAGHWVHAEQPLAFFNCLLEFIT